MPSDARQSQQFRIFYFFSSNKNLCCVINTLCSTLFLIFASLLLIFPWYHGETDTKGDVFQVSFFSVHTSNKHLCNGTKSDEMTFFLRTVTQLERVQHRNEFVYKQFFLPFFRYFQLFGVAFFAVICQATHKNSISFV